MVIIHALDNCESCLQISIHNNEAQNWYFCSSSVVQCNGLGFVLFFSSFGEARMISPSIKEATHPNMTLERHLIILWLRNMYQSLPPMKSGFRVVRQQLIDSSK